jgi:hypothetical protein
MSLESGNEALEVEEWSGKRNPKEEEEGVFITPSPELAVGAPCGLVGHPARVAGSPASLQYRLGWPGHLCRLTR